MTKVFYTKSGIRWVNWKSWPSIKEVKYIWNDWVEYTWLEFEWYASTPVLDKGWDIVLDWAFDDSLEEFTSIWAPMLLQHDDNKPVWNYPELTTSDKWLFVKWLVKLDTDNLFKALKTGVICWMSIGYSILDWEFMEQADWLMAFVIKKLRLHEISLVSIWMNQEALIKWFKDDKFKELSETEIKNQFKFNSNMNYWFEKSVKWAVDEFVKENNLNPNTKKMDKKDKWLVRTDSLESKLEDAIETKLWISENDNEDIYIVDIFTDNVVVNHYWYTDTYFDEYLQFSYSINGWEILVWDWKVVEKQIEWVDKVKSVIAEFKTIHESKTKEIETEKKEVKTPVTTNEVVENKEAGQDTEIENWDVESEVETKEVEEVKTEEVVETETEEKPVEEETIEEVETEETPEKETDDVKALVKLEKSFDDMKQNHTKELDAMKKAHQDEINSYSKKFETIESDVKSFSDMFNELVTVVAENTKSFENMKAWLKNAEVKWYFNIGNSKTIKNNADRVKEMATKGSIVHSK